MSSHSFRRGCLNIIKKAGVAKDWAELRIGHFDCRKDCNDTAKAYTKLDLDYDAPCGRVLAGWDNHSGTCGKAPTEKCLDLLSRPIIDRFAKTIFKDISQWPYLFR